MVGLGDRQGPSLTVCQVVLFIRAGGSDILPGKLGPKKTGIRKFAGVVLYFSACHVLL